jgi:hypothetical protein
MERETKEIKIGENTLVVKTYITGGEAREIEGVYLEGMQVSVDQDGKTIIPSVSADLARKAQDKTIEILVVSINGKSENILDSILELRKEEFDKVILELNTISSGLSKKKEKV